VAAGAYDGVARIWQTDDGQLVRSLPDHPGFVWTVGFNPGTNLLATGSTDSIVRIFSIETGWLMRALPSAASEVTSLAFSEDGRWLAFAGGRTVELWGLP
jgi:WD40 repeat protein